jgi:hypothetical protein
MALGRKSDKIRQPALSNGVHRPESPIHQPEEFPGAFQPSRLTSVHGKRPDTLIFDN